MAKSNVSAFQELQNSFCLVNLAGEIRLADKRQIQGALSDTKEAVRRQLSCPADDNYLGRF